MDSLVIYHSRSGNTKKVAHAIGSVVGAEVKDLEYVKPEDVKNNSLVGIGSGCYYGRPAEEIVEFLKDLDDLEGTPFFVFGTHGGQTSFLCILQSKIEEIGGKILGSWSCNGETYKGRFEGHPDDKDLEDANKFAISILSQMR